MNFEFVDYHNVRIPMRDGITLAAEVYLPNAPGPFPVRLQRTPYGATAARTNPVFCQSGYAEVWVDCRGRFLSEGSCYPSANERDDGFDTLQWLAEQPWCDGHVVMAGGSYPGLTQLTAATSGHPALKAAAPSAISASMYETYYTHGVLEMSFMPSWHIGCMCSRDVKPAPPAPDWNNLRKGLPVYTLDERAGIPCQSWKDIASNPDPESPYWQKFVLKNYAKFIHAPLFIQSSYFDLLGRRGPEIYTELMADPDTPESFKRHACLRLGPWGHGVNTQEGEYSFGDASLVTEDPELDFLNAFAHEKTPGSDTAPGRIAYFTMVENAWHYTDVWPLKNTADTPFYLGGRGRANTAAGDGLLSRIEPEKDSAPDHFTYQPSNPVPTCGGRIVGAGGQRDQSEVERRRDVLVYTSPKLAEDLTITGVVKARLFVQSSAPDTDFTVKLVDVGETGRPLNVCDTIYRMRYRNSYSRPEMMSPHQVYEVGFDVDFTSYLFRRGHAVRIEISSSNFPHYERNPNTEKIPAFESELHTAEQTVLHDSAHPSCIILPVV